MFHNKGKISFVLAFTFFLSIFINASLYAVDEPQGEVEVWVRLVDEPLVKSVGDNGKKTGGKLTRAQQRAKVQEIKNKQDTLMNQVRALGGVELGRVQKAHNAIAIRIDASKLEAVAALPGVRNLRPVVNYELDLSQTVPYVGASVVQSAGFDGTGITVAVLDSGIDYTHKNFEGAGTVADYKEAYGDTINDPRTTTLDGKFPTGKVIGGFDFVGEGWPTTVRTEDPDPIDCGPQTIAAPCAGGHGSHVADIIAGHSQDNTHKGVAPGAKLLAIKVCSARSTSCNGVAMLKGVDFALDPNSDDDISDAADVMNLSIGINYGQQEDDISEAVANAMRFGVVTVLSAGNSGDRPYVVGAGSSATEVISVAQTQVPSSRLYLIEADGASSDFSAGSVHQSWSAAPTLISAAPLFYDTTSGLTRIGCSDANGTNPWTGTPHTGRVLIIDRGTCSVSLKVANAAAAGAIAAVIANNVAQPAGDLPPSFSFGGGAQTIAGYTVTLVDGNSLKSTLPATATINPSNAPSLVQNMAPTSSRGPNYSFSAIKPEIGAPGASLSAEAGTGTGETAFSGTSGASPMVAGAAALLIDAYPTRPAMQIKSVLVNTAETDIGINPVALPGVPAGISRIGGGELRVDRALNSGSAAWEETTLNPTISFGYESVTGPTTLKKNIVVRNYSGSSKTYAISSNFRFSNDQATGAMNLVTPTSLTVPANGTKTFTVQLKITNPTSLPVWNLNGGLAGGDGSRLTTVEYDGYVTLTGGGDSIHLPWHLLPHRSAANVPASTTVNLGGTGSASLSISNATGAIDGRLDVFSLTGISTRIPNKNLPSPGDNFAIIDLRYVGVRQAGNFIQFAMNTFAPRAHPLYPAEFDVYLDLNRDGNPEYVLFNSENGGTFASGQCIVNVRKLTPPVTTTPVSFCDADLMSGNIIYTAPLSAINGLTPSTQFDIHIYSFDNYFTGALTDAIEGMTYRLDSPRFTATGVTAVPAGGSSTLNITHTPANNNASPSQTGLLLMYRDSRSAKEADAITINP